MDPLSIIREQTIKGLITNSTADDANVNFGDQYNLPRKAPTNYKPKVGKGHLTVEQIWYFVKSITADPKKSHPAYLKDATASGYAAVSMVDRKDLLDYITGKVDQSDRIDITAPTFVAPEPTVGKKREREDEEEDKDAVPKERVLHTRNSVLQCRKDFSAVLRFFVPAKSKEVNKPVPTVTHIPTNRYGEVKEEQFWRNQVGKDFDKFGIDTNASFFSKSKKAEESIPQLKAPQVKAAAPARALQARPDMPPSKSRVEGKMPIIIVPSGFNKMVLFNMFNIKEFLEDESFQTWDVNYKNEGRARPNTMIIQRKYKREKPVKYEIVDKPPNKKSEDWARVVAVFVSGAKWQFKDFPFRGADEGDLVDTFNRVRGFYAKYDVDLQLDIIKTWNVKTLSFQKNQRHADRAQAEVFWNELDKHLMLQRSKLKF